MKFKENIIKPGMVIHCPKEEDTKALLEHLKEIGYEDCCMPSLPHEFCKICNDGYVSWLADSQVTKIIEFSDLVESEPDLAVEVKDGKSTLKMRGITISEMSDENSTMTEEELLKRLTQCLTTYDVEKAKAFKRLYDIYGG